MDQTGEIEVDNFCCAGGASEGIEAATRRPIAHAINHNDKALEMYVLPLPVKP